MSVAKHRLSNKQKMFCREYIIDFNATQAYIRAGYSAKTAGQAADRLLKNVKIQAFLNKLIAERAARVEITADSVVRELAKIGFSNMDDYSTWGGDSNRLIESSELSRDQKAAVSEVQTDRTVRYGKDGEKIEDIKTKIKLYDKKGALVDIGRHLGIFEKDNKDSLMQDITINVEIVK